VFSGLIKGNTNRRDLRGVGDLAVKAPMLYNRKEFAPKSESLVMLLLRFNNIYILGDRHAMARKIDTK
jgi:hypothetical protein